MRFPWARGPKAAGASRRSVADSGAGSDREFLISVYRRMLGREPDAEGMEFHLRALRDGHPRADIVLDFAASPEFIHKTVKDNLPAYLDPLPIREERPELYGVELRKGGTDRVRVFRAAASTDFDWLERRILENGYYERPGVWSFLIDEDKRLMAEIARDLGARSVLDFGCSNGGVLKFLRDLGIDGEGVEISRLALSKTPPEVLCSIHFGDLLSLDLPRRYDLALGLDIFEHLNPNKLEASVGRLHEVVCGGGRLFANVPAFGDDPVFGEVFGVELESWEQDIASGRSFRSVPVDEYGYPKNGHMVCAGTAWWVGLFERAGFRRDAAAERDIHMKYDEAMDPWPARKAFYVFSRI